jgi:gamma-glutamyltranspeptidase/glutathione hydrolase
VSARSERQIDQFKSTAALLLKDGKVVDTLVQTDLAATIDRIAQHGSRDFYDGETAKKLIDAIREAGGVLADRDLREYAAAWRAPMRIAFRGFDVCAPPPPSTGGFIIAESLAILTGFDLDGSGKSVHLITEAERRASLDADKYLGDPTTVRVPYRELLSDERAKSWRASINAGHVTPTTMLTEPATIDSAESPHTTHFTIVDAAGNVASVTLTLDDDFGGGFFVPGLGFALNDAMHDFTANANAAASAKRPMTSMTPIIVLRSGAPFLAAGSTGGATIPTTLLQLLLDVLARKKSLSEAVSAPRYHQDARVEDITIERGRASRDVLAVLAAMGHGVRESEPYGNVAAILIGDRIVAVADPRHGGAAGGF